MTTPTPSDSRAAGPSKARSQAALCAGAALFLLWSCGASLRPWSISEARARKLVEELSAARRQAEPRKGLSAVRSLLRAFPDRPEYLRAEAELLSELGRPARAAASWEAFMRSAPLPIEACPGLGKAYEAAGEIDRSLEAHRRCLALDPTQSDLRLFLAISLEHRERFEEAERLYRETLADSPSYQDARTGLARVLLRRDRLDEARQEISAVLAARPADADALFAAGLIAEKRGDLAQAKVFLKQAIAANPSYDEPIQALSRLERLP